MDYYDICINIIIPLASAFVGGFITLAGVWLTIKRDIKREADNHVKSVKPWIYSINNLKSSDYQGLNDIVMATSVNYESKSSILIIIQNTDNGVAIVDKLVTEKKVYYPIISSIIGKNSVMRMFVNFEKGETIKDMYLYVRDVLGNQYKYEVFHHEDKSSIYCIREVTEKKEKNNDNN